MIMFSAVLLMLLFFVAYYIYVLYNGLDNSSSQSYAALELKLQGASAEYIQDRNLEDSKVIISLNDLVRAKYINFFEDDDGNDCNGYVIYEDYSYNSYLSCLGYTSSGYNRSYE